MSLTLERYIAIAATLVAGIFVVFSHHSAHADSLSLDLNDDAARISWASLREPRNIRFDASLLHHQDRGNVVSGGFHITGNAATQSRPINAGLGGRLYWAGSDSSISGDRDGFALAVGGFFEAKVPNYDRLGFGGHVYFAPDVLAFGDMKQLSDISFFGSYSVLRQGDIYLGIRNVKADYSGLGDFTFDTGVHVGFTLNF